MIGCSSSVITNTNHNNMIFSDIKSDFIITDTNSYDCKKIDNSIIKHVLKTGVVVSQRNIHDYYDTTGCSTKGSVIMNNSPTKFTFEYGGIINLSNGTQLGCAEICCKNDFEYCTWDINGLK